MNDAQLPKILIVEDDPDQRSLLAEALCLHYGDPEGENLTLVGTGKECLELDLTSFDVVLQDFNLPDMSGLDLLGGVLARADLPVIFVTGENDSQTAAEAVRRGAQDYVIKMGEYLFALPIMIDKALRQHEVRKDNERLRKQLESMLAELQVRNEQLRQSLEELERVAATDPVTGLANRRRFNELLHTYFSEAMRYQTDLTCCMCDLDHYKEFNDTFGHQAGDDILAATAEVICSSIRGSDIAARYGGDEFVLLLPHTTIEEAVAAGQRIREQLTAAGRRYGQLDYALGLSVGVASVTSHRPRSADELVAMADRALYVAKDRGRGRTSVYTGAGPHDRAAS